MARAKQQPATKKTINAAINLYRTGNTVQDGAIVSMPAGVSSGPRCGSREDYRRVPASTGGIFVPAQHADHGADSPINGKPCREGASPAVTCSAVLPHSARRPSPVEGGETSDNLTTGARHER